MATRKKKGSKESPVTLEEQAALKEKPYVITEGKLKDEFCIYSYDVKHGIGVASAVGVKGGGFVLPDMHRAFEKLRVHMASVDDAFKLQEMNDIDIDSLHNDETTNRYHVTGFKMFGGIDNDSVVLIGNKFVSLGGRIEVKTPKIDLTNLSGYKWYNELKEAVESVRREVELYKEGKYTMPEKEEDADARQMTIGDQLKEEEQMLKGDDDEDDFDKALVK